MKRLSVNPSNYGPFLCVLCEDEIKPRRMHVILSALSSMSDASGEDREASATAMVCSRCMDLSTSHAALYPDCDRRGCDLADHAYALTPDRAAAVALLIDLGRMQYPERPPTRGITP